MIYTSNETTSIFVSQNKNVEHRSIQNIRLILQFFYKIYVLGIILVFDINRTKIAYSSDDIAFAKFNRSFKYLMAGLDRLNINLFDNRTNKNFMKIEQAGSNCISFNPQRGYIFACGNEDGNSYLLEMNY